MPTKKDIVLRPRFKLNINEINSDILNRFEETKFKQSEFIVTRVDNHIFIKYPKKEQHFWTPQLHIEIDPADENSSLIRGLFGPNPTVWTFFMFLHFLIASLFIVCIVWGYSNASLNKGYLLQVWLMLLMVIIWCVLYFVGRLGKDSSKKEMKALYDFMEVTLQKKSFN